MNPIISVDSKDFILQSLNCVGSKLPRKAKYILLVKSYRCGYCVQYMPQFEQFANRFPNIGFLTLEASINHELIDSWNQLRAPIAVVNGYPTLIIYDMNGNPEDYEIKDRNKLDEDIVKLLFS